MMPWMMDILCEDILWNCVSRLFKQDTEGSLISTVFHTGV